MGFGKDSEVECLLVRDLSRAFLALPKTGCGDSRMHGKAGANGRLSHKVGKQPAVHSAVRFLWLPGGRVKAKFLSFRVSS